MPPTRLDCSTDNSRRTLTLKKSSLQKHEKKGVDSLQNLSCADQIRKTVVIITEGQNYTDKRVFESQIAQSLEQLSSSASDEIRSEGNHPPCQRDFSGGVRLKLMMEPLQRTPQTLREAWNRQLKFNLRGERTCEVLVPKSSVTLRRARSAPTSFNNFTRRVGKVGPDGVGNMECTCRETERQPWSIHSGVVAVIVTCNS